MRLQVSDVSPVKIPGAAGRKKVVFRNPTGGATVFWGYESTVTANLGDANCGIPLYAGEGMAAGEGDGNQGVPVYLIAVSGGGVVYYTTC